MSYEYDKDVQLNIAVEMNLNVAEISRSGYTILDLVSDIGGI